MKRDKFIKILKSGNINYCRRTMIIKKDVDDIEIINDVIIINDKSDLYLYSCEEIPPNLQFIGNIILKSK